MDNLYYEKIQEPKTLSDLKKNRYYVYILTNNENPIVVGHGKINRAKIIFDDKNQITKNHIKSIFVRLYSLYGINNCFNRFVIPCKNKEEAKIIEKKLHKQIGGNKCILPDEIIEKLFLDLSTDSIEYMALKIALCSSFDGISDLKKWKRGNILNEKVCRVIEDKLKISLY